MIICLKPYRAFAVKQVLKVEIPNEIGVSRVESVVAITKITIENQPVVEQLTRQSEINLHITEVALVTANVR